MIVLILSSACAHRRPSKVYYWEAYPPSKEELSRFKSRLVDVRATLATMGADELIEEFKDSVDLPAYKVITRGVRENEFLLICANYLIEKELVDRGKAVEETLTRHRNDTRAIYTGGGKTVGIIGDLCEYHLERLAKKEGSGELYLSPHVGTDDMSALLLEVAKGTRP